MGFMGSIKRLSARDVQTAKAWDEFVLACPAATFFHRSGWQKILSDVFGHEAYFLYAEADGDFLVSKIDTSGNLHLTAWRVGML